MPTKSINTCKTKIAHWALQNIELQSHISDAYLKAKINDTTHIRSTIFSTHDNHSCKQPLIQKAVLAVHSRETRNFSRDSSRFLRDESRFSRYESRFSRYESRFLREGGNLHLSGTVYIKTTHELFGVRNGSENKACFWVISPLKASKWPQITFCILSNVLSCISERFCLNFEQINIPPRPAPSSFLDRIFN